jgi:hypothetical protein
VPAEAGLDRLLGVLALVEGEGRLGEFRDHVLGGEIAEVAALGGGLGVDRLLAGDIGEIGAAIELLDDLVGLVLAVDQDVAGPHLHHRGHFLEELLVAGLDRLVADLRLEVMVEHRLADLLVLVVGHLGLDRRVVLQVLPAPFGGQQVEVDQALDQRRKQLLDLLLVGLGQAARRLDDVGAVQLLAVDLGDHRIAGRRRRAGGRRRGRGLGHRQGRQRHEAQRRRQAAQCFRHPR